MQSRLDPVELRDVFDSLPDFVLPVFLDGQVDYPVILLEIGMDGDK